MTPDSFYSLKKSGKLYALQAHGEAAGVSKHEIYNYALNHAFSLRFPFFSYKIDSIDIFHIFFEIPFTPGIKEIRTWVDDTTSEEIVEILREVITQNGSHAWQEYQFIRNKGWVLRSFKSKYKAITSTGRTSISSFTLHNDYEGQQDGIALLKKAVSETYSFEDKDEAKLVKREVYDIKKIRLGSLPPATFNVNQFISYDIGKSPKYNLFRIVCILLGLFFIALGIYLKRKSK